MEKVRKNTKGKKVRIIKGRLALLMLFIMWTIFSGMFLAKVIGPSVELWVLSDKYQYAQEFGNPYNRTGQDEAFKAYNDYANSLINSDDAVLSFYAQQAGFVKMALITIALVPFIIIISFVVSAHNEEKARKKAKQLKSRTSRSFRKPAGVN